MKKLNLVLIGTIIGSIAAAYDFYDVVVLMHVHTGILMTIIDIVAMPIGFTVLISTFITLCIAICYLIAVPTALVKLFDKTQNKDESRCN